MALWRIAAAIDPRRADLMQPVAILIHFLRASDAILSCAYARAPDARGQGFLNRRISVNQNALEQPIAVGLAAARSRGMKMRFAERVRAIFCRRNRRGLFCHACPASRTEPSGADRGNREDPGFNC